MPLDSDMLERQQIFLGGQISNKYKVFQQIAKMSPDYCDLYFLIKKMPEWEQEQDETKVILDMLEIFGEIDLVRNCTELTRLSMIIGDTRGRFQVKGVIDELRKSGANPQT